MEFKELKNKLRQLIRTSQNEERDLNTYRVEKEQLLVEKNDLLEFLKLNSNDIHSIDNVIKQTEEENKKRLQDARQAIHEMTKIKNNINQFRSDFGLSRMDDDLFLDNELDLPDAWLEQMRSSAEAAQLTNAANNALGLLTSKAKLPQQPTSHLASFYGKQSNEALERKIERAMPSSICQQPPPMKTCLHCSQQIHRNAPICPYCKAKSRSRNPKKPKRKMDS
jgi:hypothetical protein